MWSVALALNTAALLACSDSTEPEDPGAGDPSQVALAVEVVASGLNSPVFLTSPPGDSRLFVVEQAGTIRIVESGQVLAAPFLDIRARVRSGGERGLLSFAFHPQYASNGFLYVNYTRDPDGATRVERYAVTADPNVADPASAKEILTVAQPASNHNGGLNVFGPDGMLYIGLGDGGGGGDTFGSGQQPGTLLGSLLRIDVDSGDPYASPPDNPFVGDPAGRDEIWAYGLRNPWRYSFDRTNGNLYIADVGQNSWEEVNVASPSAGGLNYGWNITEGMNCFGSGSCDMTGLFMPVLEYGHSDGCSITGGYVYRGVAIPDIVGHYFYSDACTGFLRSFRFTGSGIADEIEWDVGDVSGVFSFGEDAAGELYIVSSNGSVYRLLERE